MKPCEIKKGIYWVGALDWNVRAFHGHTYTTQRGTTYNAYLIVDEKIALVDTVYAPFQEEMIDRIRAIVPPGKIDYIIANHVETDHSGALGALLKLCPSAQVFGTAKCKEGLYKHYYGDWHFQVVKTGDTLSLGKRTLTFIEAPMIHWPDSMFTYCREEELLLPNDAFGQHYATSQRFNDEVDPCALLDEAAKYYANILWPLGSVIAKKIDELIQLKLPVTMIAPSHGVIWRTNPMQIVTQYQRWAKNETQGKAVIVYETMWQSTARMARAIADGMSDAGVPVKIFDVAQTDRTEIIKEMLDARGFLIGSSTHDNDLLPTIGSFLIFMRGLKPRGRSAAAFGSYGWGGGATAKIEEMLKEGGIDSVQPALGIRYVPDTKELEACYHFGKTFAEKMQNNR